MSVDPAPPEIGKRAPVVGCDDLLVFKRVREVLIRSTWTVPRASETSAGRPDGEALARQVDVALMAVGFKALPRP